MAMDPVKGKKVRWSYDDGPMKGKTFEHAFSDEGTVTFAEIKPGEPPAKDGQPPSKYEAARVSDGVYAVSYLTSHGWTLTTVVDEKGRGIVSFASNEKELVPQRGRLV